ncbi:hypothetical protein K523DRAFT_353558 [Schizophyllum commune Tattone D]|nr:hypothetical protein K523DRAFT_353558 [Schizophyllum commune Tattone D]
MSGAMQTSSDSPPAYEFIADHSKNTPDTRPSWLSEAFQAHARWVFGDDTSMVTGSKDPLHTVHILERCFQARQPAKYRALRANVGEDAVCANGRLKRGLNLDAPFNMDRLDPTMHAMLDGKPGHVCWSPLPVGWEELADDVLRAKDDRLSLSKIRSGYVFAFNVLTFDGMSFDALIYDVDGPFRPSTGPVQASTGAGDATAQDPSAHASTSATEAGEERTAYSPTGSSPDVQAPSPNSATLAADAGEERAASSTAPSSSRKQSTSTSSTAPATDVDEARPAGSTQELSSPHSIQPPRRHRDLKFTGLCVAYIFYSTVHPVIALYAIMLKFQERLHKYKSWPPYMKTVYDYLEPRLRHLFVCPTERTPGTKLLASGTPAGGPRKKINGLTTQTVPAGSPPRTRSRVKALTAAQNEAKRDIPRKTRSQTAKAAQLPAGASLNNTAPVAVKTKNSGPAGKQPQTRPQGSRIASPSELPVPARTLKEKATDAKPDDGKPTDKPAPQRRKVRTGAY